MTTQETPSVFDSLLRLPNVVLNPKRTQNGTPKLHFHHRILFDTIYKLAVKEPTWNIVIDGYSNSIGTLLINEAEVSCNGEKLGELALDYYRGDYKVTIESHRVSNLRGKQRTADAAKALAICKKVFIPRSLHERVAKSHTDASRALGDVRAKFGSVLYRTEKNLFEGVAFKFVFAKYKQEFVDHLIALDPKNQKAVDDYEEAKIHHLTVEQVYQKFDKGNTALVILDSGKYIVRQNDNVQMYDADTLPENLRGKLGILKLVEEGQVVSDTGCRVNAEVFVVVADEAQT